MLAGMATYILVSGIPHHSTCPKTASGRPLVFKIAIRKMHFARLKPPPSPKKIRFSKKLPLVHTAFFMLKLCESFDGSDDYKNGIFGRTPKRDSIQVSMRRGTSADCPRP
jgi:hypothetical protein